MMIYGVAILAACFLVGKVLGAFLGQLMGIDSNVGGVGFSMILLILVNQWLHRFRRVSQVDAQLEGGMIFWSNLYIPVIVAMSAIQNVKGALSGGWIAVLAGTIPVGICIMLVPWISRMTRRSAADQEDSNQQDQ